MANVGKVHDQIYAVVNVTFTDGSVAYGIINKSSKSTVTCGWIKKPHADFNCNVFADIVETFFSVIHSFGLRFEYQYFYLTNVEPNGSMELEDEVLEALKAQTDYLN